MAVTELDTALAVASGASPSPTRLRNSDYVALRLSGTGVAFRASLKEFVFRDPDIWLTDEMRRRFLGLPVVVEHPPSGEMTSRDFGDSAVGVVVATYVRDDELWGVARVVDAAAAAMISEGVFDTSPSVVFDGDAGAFVDHVALVYTGDGNKGVWTRSDGGNGPGVELTEAKDVGESNDGEPTKEREI
jgi:colicin import membrane protein